MKIIRSILAGVSAVSLFCGVLPAVYAENEAESEAAAYSGDLRWDFTTDSEGFKANSQASIIGVNNGALEVAATEVDPNISIENIEIKSAEHRYLRFRIKNPTSSMMVQAYIYQSSPWQSFNINSYYIENNSSEFADYEIDLYEIENSSVVKNYTDKETYPGFRFDFLNGSGGVGQSVEIDWIVFSANSMYDDKQNLVSSVTIGDMAVEEFESTVDCCETGLYADIYNNLSPEDIIAETDGEITSVKIKNVTDRKLIDITVTNGEYSNTYRIICKSVKRPPEPVDIEITKCEIAGKTISIAGKLNPEKADKLSLIAHPKNSGYDKDDILYMALLKADENGGFEKAFTLYDDESSAKLYDIELVFDILGEDEPALGYVSYVNNTKIAQSVADMKSGSDGVLKYMVKAENKPVYNAAGVWLELYEGQTSAVKSAIDSAADGFKSEITSENAARIANGSILSVILEDTDDGKLTELISEYDKKIFRLEVDGKSFSELDSDAQTRIVKNLKNEYGTKVSNWENFEKAVRENMLLDLVNTVPYTSLKELLLNNTDILGNEMTSLKNQSSKSITDEAMKAVSKTAKSSGFKNVETLITAVETGLANAGKSASSSGNSGGGGGGGGGSSSVSSIQIPVNTPTATQQPQTTAVPSKETAAAEGFKDLSGYEWAADAVNALYKAGVVSGVSEDSFEPARAVTREEFVKLIVEAFGYGKDADLTYIEQYSDITADDWFAPYVAKASELGIINGTGDAAFGTGQNMKREDMVTILYRAMTMQDGDLLASAETAEGRFDDYANIPDYAKAAVNTFVQMGIVNGVSDSTFGAGMITNRAEAAVIIQRCMEKF